MPKFYLSFRPQDSSANEVRHILADLMNAFGQSQVQWHPSFDELNVFDVEKAVKASDFLVVVIGEYWANLVDVSGENVLKSVYDPVHMAVVTALENRIPIIPILVDDARMPLETELPREMRLLARYEPIAIGRNDILSVKIAKLIEDIKQKPVHQWRVQQRQPQSSRPVQTPWQQQTHYTPQHNAIWVRRLMIASIIIIAGLFVFLSTDSEDSPAVLPTQISLAEMMETEVTEAVPTIRPTQYIPEATQAPPLLSTVVAQSTFDAINGVDTTDFSWQDLATIDSIGANNLGYLETVVQWQTGNLDTLIETIALSPNGRWLAIDYRNGDLEIRETLTGELHTRMNERQYALNMIFTVDSQHLVINHGLRIEFWSVEGRRVVSTIQTEPRIVRRMAVSADGDWLGTVGDDIVSLWHIETLYTSNLEETAIDHDQHMKSLLFSPDSSALILGGIDGTMYLFDTLTHQQLSEIEEYEAAVTALATHPIESVVVSADSLGHIRLRSSDFEGYFVGIASDAEAIDQLAFSADGELLFSRDDIRKKLQIWSVDRRDEADNAPIMPNHVAMFALDDAGKVLVIATENGTILVKAIAEPS